jgi:tRNA U34 5-methylaminomethyl-2-thiouridine-forming methyltransferase MnmC
VYIRNGFEAWLHHYPDAKRIRIFEMGFGTGLNVLLTASAAIKHPRLVVDYTAVELHPLPEEIWRQLDFPESTISNLPDLIHGLEFGRMQEITDRFFLTKHQADILDYSPEMGFDVIYFDAFGPRAQPELWTEVFLKRIAGWLNPGGRLVTYCTKGYVKRGFRSGAFNVKSLPGPPGKREMLCVTLPAAAE